MLVATCALQAAAAQETPHRARRVELITVQGDAARPIAARPEQLAPGPGANDFAVHDLSRRWVAFQMAGSFAAPAAGEARDAAERDFDAADVPRAAMLTVPLWMRGGPLPGTRPSYQPGCVPLAYRPTGFLRADAEQRRAAYYALMSAIACEHDLPVGLFDAMIIQESRYRADVFSPKNAFGLTQLMPGTAAALGVDRHSIEGNLRGGARYLRQQLDRFGHYHLALAAYNAGPGRVRGGRVPEIAETRSYVGAVLANWTRLSGVTPHGGTTYSALAPLQASARRADVDVY
jgi:hypothetical protein